MNKDWNVPLAYIPDVYIGEPIPPVAEPKDSWSSRLSQNLRLMSPLSCAILLAGIFSNVLAIGVLQHAHFRQMKMPFYLIVGCGLNVCILFFATFKIHSCFADADVKAKAAVRGSPFHNDPEMEASVASCLAIGWVYFILDYMIGFNMLFAIHNRFTYMGTYDITTTILKAKRIPVLCTVTTAVLSIVPSSLYHTKKKNQFENVTSNRCSRLFVFPYNHTSAWDTIISAGPLGVDTLLALGLAVLLTRHFVVARRRKRSGYSDGTSLAAAFSSSSYDVRGGTATSKDLTSLKETKLSQLIDVVKRKGRDFRWLHLLHREASMHKLTAIVVFSYVVCVLPKHLAGALHDLDSPRGDPALESLLSEFVFMVYAACTFIIYFVSSTDFRRTANDILFLRPQQTDYYTDMKLARRMKILDANDEDERARAANTNGVDEEGEKIGGGGGGSGRAYWLEDFHVTPAQLRLEDVQLAGPSPGAAGNVFRRSVASANHCFKSVVEDNNTASTWL